MRAMRATLTGDLTIGDCIMLHYCAARGGRTSAGHYVVNGDTIESVLVGLINSAKTYFLADSEVKASKGNLTIVTAHPDGDWVTEVLGAKTEKFTIEEL